jgi:hypothetical protein
VRESERAREREREERERARESEREGEREEGRKEGMLYSQPDRQKGSRNARPQREGCVDPIEVERVALGTPPRPTQPLVL